jgi:hypothetical protein
MSERFIDTQAEAWTEIKQRWSGNESCNGPGSTMELTKEIRRRLPDIFVRYDIKTVLDIACGDWTWMQHVSLDYLTTYSGVDVEPSIIKDNNRRFGNRNNVRFYCLNVLNMPASPSCWPAVDLILCKDFLYHLPNEHISDLLLKITSSGSRYLLTTTFPGASNERPYDGSQDGIAGYMASAVDLTQLPFNLPIPIESFAEEDSIATVWDDSGIGKPGAMVGHVIGLFELPQVK